MAEKEIIAATIISFNSIEVYRWDRVRMGTRSDVQMVKFLRLIDDGSPKREKVMAQKNCAFIINLKINCMQPIVSYSTMHHMSSHHLPDVRLSNPFTLHTKALLQCNPMQMQLFSGQDSPLNFAM